MPPRPHRDPSPTATPTSTPLQPAREIAPLDRDFARRLDGGGAGHPPARALVAHLRDGTPVAGWLAKANPAVWDVESHLAEHGRIDSWRLMHGYRADLVAAGHPFVLWLTGPRAGVIAVGRVTGPAVVEHRDAEHANDRSNVGPRPYCPVDAVAVVPPIAKADLLATFGFGGAEVVRTPRSGNPLALTPDELDLIADLLPTDPWADLWADPA